MTFPPVRTLEDLDSLAEADIVDGYLSAQRGDPEPGGRAFWHGWRNRMLDWHLIEDDGSAAQLASLWLARERERRTASAQEVG